MSFTVFEGAPFPSRRFDKVVIPPLSSISAALGFLKSIIKCKSKHKEWRWSKTFLLNITQPHALQKPIQTSVPKKSFPLGWLVHESEILQEARNEQKQNKKLTCVEQFLFCRFWVAKFRCHRPIYPLCRWSISPTFYEQLLRQYSFAKKITNPNCKVEKSCPKHFHKQNLLVKCWWHWHLLSDSTLKTGPNCLSRSSVVYLPALLGNAWGQKSIKFLRTRSLVGGQLRTTMAATSWS